MDLIQNNDFLRNIYFLFFKDLFRWKRRALRVQYIARFFIMFFLLFIGLKTEKYFFETEDWSIIILFSLYTVILIIFVLQTFPLTVRRLHDLNLSGWWLLVTFLPLMGQISLIVLSILKGNEGTNKYGEPPNET